MSFNVTLSKREAGTALAVLSKLSGSASQSRVKQAQSLIKKIETASGFSATRTARKLRNEITGEVRAGNRPLSKVAAARLAKIKALANDVGLDPEHDAEWLSQLVRESGFVFKKNTK